MLDRDRAESVEAVRLDPEVRIWEAAAQLGRVDEQLEGARDLTARGGNEPEAAQRNALPAWIADLGPEGECVFEALLRRSQVPSGEVELAAKRLWPRHEGGHASCLHRVESLIQAVARLLDLAA
jgi:hypothetical protein